MLLIIFPCIIINFMQLISFTYTGLTQAKADNYIIINHDINYYKIKLYSSMQTKKNNGGYNYSSLIAVQ